jgi:hypothetical protein
MCRIQRVSSRKHPCNVSAIGTYGYLVRKDLVSLKIAQRFGIADFEISQWKDDDFSL